MEIRARQKFWISFVFGGWFLLFLWGRFYNPPLATLFWLLLLQQLLFSLAGLLGSRRRLLQFPPLKKAMQGLVWGLVLFFVNIVVAALVLKISSLIFGSELAWQLAARERGSIQLFLESDSPLLARGIVLMLLLGAPLSEELFFRGLFLDFCRQKLGTYPAIVLAALVFASLHFYLIQFIPVLCAGILLGIIFVRAGNIFVPAFAHSVANGLTLLVLLLNL